MLKKQVKINFDLSLWYG